MKGLGRVLNVVGNASGVGIKLKDATAVTFVTYESDGSTIATITQRDSSGVNGEVPLVCSAYPHKAPGAGGTWTAMSNTAASSIDLDDDTTNNCMVFTVDATMLADGYDTVEVTTDGGSCVAILHDLTVQRKPTNLASPVL